MRWLCYATLVSLLGTGVAWAVDEGAGIDFVDGAVAATIVTAGSDGDSATTSSDSGLEFIGGNLTLLRGCPIDGQVLEWDEPTDVWQCATPSGSGDIIDVGDCATGACFTGSSGTKLTSTTGEILDLSSDGELIYQRDTAGTVTIRGKDNSDPADTVYTTAGAGAVALGGAGVTGATIDGGTGNVTVDSAAGIPLTQSFTQCITLDGSFIRPAASNGCQRQTITGTSFLYDVCSFDTTTQECGYITSGLPLHVTGTALQFTIGWTPTNTDQCSSASDDGVAWRIDTDSVGNNELWHTLSAIASTATTVVDTCGTSAGDEDKLYYSGASAPLFTAHTHAWTVDGTQQKNILEICRIVGDAGDDYGNDAHIVEIKLCYETDNMASGE